MISCPQGSLSAAPYPKRIRPGLKKAILKKPCRAKAAQLAVRVISNAGFIGLGFEGETSDKTFVGK